MLLRQDNIKRVHWPLGRIVKIFPGRDNVIRTVEIKMADNTILKRSVQMLHRLETFEDDFQITDAFNDNVTESESPDRCQVRDVIIDAGFDNSFISDPDSEIPPDILVQSSDNMSDSLIDTIAISTPNIGTVKRKGCGRGVRAPKKI